MDDHIRMERHLQLVDADGEELAFADVFHAIARYFRERYGDDGQAVHEALPTAVSETWVAALAGGGGFSLIVTESAVSRAVSRLAARRALPPGPTAYTCVQGSRDGPLPRNLAGRLVGRGWYHPF